MPPTWLAANWATLPHLPGSEQPQKGDVTHSFAFNAAEGRHGTFAAKIEYKTDTERALVCECEGVSVGEIKYAVGTQHVHNLINLRRRTRVGMGTCQGKLCACRAASLLGRFSGNVAKAEKDLADFLDERWKGVKPVAWGSALREAQLTATIYQGLCGLNKAIARKEGSK